MNKNTSFLLTTVLIIGCSGPAAVPCLENTDCDRSPGGVCELAESGNRWCAYPNAECPSGFRYSDLDVGDGLRGECVPPIDTSEKAFLTTYGGTDIERTVGLHGVSDGYLWTGYLGSDATLGTFPLVYGGGSDSVISKLSAKGDPVWVRALNSEFHEQIAASIVDSSGNLLIVGRFAGSVSFGGSPLTSAAGGDDIFVAKYSGSTGDHLWSIRFGGAAEELATSMTVDTTGDVYVAGQFSGTTNLGGSNLTSAGLTDGFIAKYRGADGAFVWGRAIGSTEQDIADDVALDGNRLAVAGQFRGTINAGGASLVSQGGSDIFVVGLDPVSGTHVWSQRYGSSGNDHTNTLIAGDGSLYIAGSFTGTPNLGGTTLTSKGGVDVYVAKYDITTGSHIWSKSFGGGGIEVPYALLLEGANLSLTGSFDQSIDFGGPGVNSAGQDDIFVATLSQAEGAYVDTWRIGGTADDTGTALTAAAGGGLVLGGFFLGVAYFGSIQGTGAGSSDAFVFRP